MSSVAIYQSSSILQAAFSRFTAFYQSAWAALLVEIETLKTIETLRALSNRELDDMNISRAEIEDLVRGR